MSKRSSVVKIKLKRGGWEVEIECEEDRVGEVVSRVLSSFERAAVPSAEEVKRGITCKKLIEKMWLEGLFITSRRLVEVDEELARRGYHYDRTAVSHALMDLVREGILTREGSPRSYRYVQKKPPGSLT